MMEFDLVVKWWMSAGGKSVRWKLVMMGKEEEEEGQKGGAVGFVGENAPLALAIMH